MSRIKPSRIEILLNYKLWLSSVTGEGVIEETNFKLLKGIHEKGSLRAASKEIGLSYRKAWGDLKKAEGLLGYQLTARKRGGISGGKSELTTKAIKLLQAYEALHVKLDDAVEKAYEDFRQKMNSKT
jgi:molybdate transport system regulatory protein